MSRLLITVAVGLGAVYIVWAALVLPDNLPPIGFALASFLSSMGAIVAQRRPRRAK